MESKKYTVAILGLGPRGLKHIIGFKENPDKFEIVGLCDLRQERIDNALKQVGNDCFTTTNAEELLSVCKPDVFCFVTLPDIRLEMVKLAAKYKVKGLAFEKPMATSLNEAREITKICNENNIKAIVSHQQKYIPSMQVMKNIIDSGALGKIERIHINCRANLTNLGTHFVDYAIWANNGCKIDWVCGHVHGRVMLEDSHPSPDFVMSECGFSNGVRLFCEIGYLSPMNLDKHLYWTDNRLTVYGSTGYAWAETEGSYAYFTKDTKGELISGFTSGWGEVEPLLQIPYLKEFAEWLGDDAKVHSCNVNIAQHGYEILDAMCISALENTRIDIPIKDVKHDDVFEELKKILPEVSGTKITY